MEWMLLASLAPVAFKAISEAITAGDRAKADALRQQAMDEYNIPLPDLQELETEMQGRSETYGVSEDPRYVAGTNTALEGLTESATTGGLTPEDIQTLEQAKLRAADVDAGLRGRNAQQMSARGITGSGLDLAAQEGAAQAGAQRAYEGGIDAAGDASRRRMGALNSLGSFSARLREFDTGRKERQATSQDAINAFNTRDKRNVRDSNQGLEQQRFDNKMRRGSARAGAARTRAGDYERSAERTGELWEDVGEATSDAAAAYGKGKKK